MAYGQMPGGMGLLSQMDPSMLGQFIMMASQNPAAFAAVAEAGGLPLPNTQEWQELFGQAADVGTGFDTDPTGPGFTAPMIQQLQRPAVTPRTVRTAPVGATPAANPSASPLGNALMSTGAQPAVGGIGAPQPAGGPPPAVPELPEPEVNTGPTFGDPMATNPLLAALMPGGAGPAGPAGDPMQMAKQMAQQQAGGFPAVRMPQAPQPEFRAGITGAQKAPDTFQPIKPGMTPAQALMMAILGGKGGKQQGGGGVNSLGDLLG